MTNMTAIGDQVQATVQNSPCGIIAFVLIANDGTIEYRSPLSRDELKELLQIVSNIF